MRFQSVTFDLDGTLLDTIPDLAKACQGMLAELAQPTRSLEEIHRFVGKGMAVLVERCLTWDAPADPALLAKGIDAFRRHYATVNSEKAKIYPQVVAGLEAFRAAGCLMGVVTNKPFEFTVPLLQATGLAPFFDVIVGGDTTPFKKPHPEPILFACRQMAVSSEKNLHIGDSENDVLSAVAAGSRAYLVPYGYNEGLAVDSVECDALVSDLLVAYQHAIQDLET